MFTGIIQNLGQIQAIEKDRKSVRLTIRFQKKERRIRLGESIAVNGVCLTIARVLKAGFAADLLPETLTASNLGFLGRNSWVNLERSLKKGDEIGGHFVTGHVDAIGKIVQILRRGANWSLLVSAPKNIISSLALKGSIACDGVSLTIQRLESKRFAVAAIPHTLSVTTLGKKKVGDSVNLEIDLVMRYLKRFNKLKSNMKLSISALTRQGF